MIRHIKHMYVTVGLPGAGKTSWANKVDNFIRIDVDSIKNLESKLKYGYFTTEPILDGLFLNQSDISKILGIMTSGKSVVNKLTIARWEPDVEACLWNDLYRREQGSEITITNAIVGDFSDISELRNKYPDTEINVMNMVTERKKPYEVFADKHELYLDENGVQSGESWCTGGTWSDCWGSSGVVEGSDPVSDMDELTDILEKEVPNITFLQYKKLKSECISIKDFSDGDYYGGTTYHKRIYLNVKKLYELLVEKELIKEIE